MITTKDYIKLRFGYYTGLNITFLNCFEDWDGYNIQDFLEMYIESYKSNYKKEELETFKRYVEDENFNFHSLLLCDNIFGICLNYYENHGYNLSNLTKKYISNLSGFWNMNPNKINCFDIISLEEVIKLGIQFEKIKKQISYRKLSNWFSEIYWNPHYIWGKKFLENRIDRDEIY